MSSKLKNSRKKKSGEPKKKSQRKKRTLRKRKIKRKSLKFGGSQLTPKIQNLNLKLPSIQYQNKEKRTTGILNNIWSSTHSLEEGEIKIKCGHLYLNKTIPFQDGPNKPFYVLWVRHCHSCSNEANPLWHYKNKFFREPLCSGNDSLLRAINLGSFVKTNNRNIEFNFFSSFLPRAMETAKAISFGMKTDTPETNKKIKILEHISEEKNYVDYTMAQFHNVGTQNATTPSKFKRYVSFLNDNFNGLTIDDNFQSDKKTLSSSGDIQDDYRDFLEKYILSNKLFSGPGNVNVIVSHGGYIRQNVIEPIKILEGKSQISHPDNVQPILVKYTYDENLKEIVINSERIDVAGKKEIVINSEIIDDFYKPTLLSKILKSNPCNLSYENDIKKIEMHPDFFSNEEGSKENQTFKGIRDDQL